MSPTEIDRERLADDKDYRLEFRHRCQTDGFFLAPLMGYHDFLPRIHQPVADLYVAKTPGVSIADQDTVKNRMHLDPRHTFKTTYGFVDTTQWVFVDPNVTIANVTATRALGTLLVQRLSRVFYQPKTKPPTILQLAFPEYVIHKNKGNYIAPCRTRDEVEPTIYATSPGSSQSGWHPWILNPDDMVDNENSGIDASDDSRDHIWNTYQTNLNTLRHGGYVNIRGTRYHPFDTYGRLLRVMDAAEWRLLIRSYLTVKAKDKYGRPKRLIEGEFPGRDEVELHFQELLPYEILRTKFREDYRSFMCQQQNDPQGGGVAMFPVDRYNQARIEPERIPSFGEVRICWRLACDKKAFMKYSEGVALKTSGSRLYQLDAWRGIFTPTELYQRIVTMAKRHQCGEVTIERTPGSDDAIVHIQNEAIRQNWSLRIDRPEYDEDDSVRKSRMLNLEPLMQAGRLWFSLESGQVEEVRNQFTNFGLIEQNGFVDCVSRLARKVSASILTGQVSAEQRAMLAASKERGIYDLIYGAGGAVQVEEAVIADHHKQRSSTDTYGLTPMLGGLDG